MFVLWNCPHPRPGHCTWPCWISRGSQRSTSSIWSGPFEWHPFPPVCWEAVTGTRGNTQIFLAHFTWDRKLQFQKISTAYQPELPTVECNLQWNNHGYCIGGFFNSTSYTIELHMPFFKHLHVGKISVCERLPWRWGDITASVLSSTDLTQCASRIPEPLMWLHTCVIQQNQGKGRCALSHSAGRGGSRTEFWSHSLWTWEASWQRHISKKTEGTLFIFF